VADLLQIYHSLVLKSDSLIYLSIFINYV